MDQMSKVDAYELGRMVVQDSGIMADLMQDRTVEGISRLENVQELMDGMHDFLRSRQEEGNEAVTLADFLSDVALLTDQDNTEEDDTPKVTLMTVHAAKGLEFDTVFIVGMEEQLFPSMMAYDSIRQMEEERRLLYVAITRAEKRCILSYAKSRFRFGKVEYGMPSRFLKDIDRGYMESTSKGSASNGIPKPNMWTSQRLSGTQSSHRPQVSQQSGAAAPRRTVVPESSDSYSSVKSRTDGYSSSTHRHLVSVNTSGGATQVARLTPGQFIEHERFGVGEVLKVEGVGENTKAHIRFDNAGEKQLLLKFARFRVLS
jgi:DNA helicase-2/ATP-dependent DNA helicase PcrA